MITIKQAIYNALSGDKQKVKLFSQRTNEANIVQMKYQVYLILAQKGYQLDEIAEEANVCRSTVYRGIQHGLGNKMLKRDKLISNDILTRITLGKNKMSKGALYAALIKDKIARKTISRHFGITINFLKNEIAKNNKTIEREILAETKSKIIRFRD